MHVTTTTTTTVGFKMLLDRNAFSRYNKLANPSGTDCLKRKERDRRLSSSGESHVFQVRPPGRSSAVWTCLKRYGVGRKDTRRVTVCTSALVFLSERWLIKIRALSRGVSPYACYIPSSRTHRRVPPRKLLCTHTRAALLQMHTRARSERAEDGRERKTGACLNVYLAARNTLTSHVRIEIMSSKESIVS